MLKPPPKPWVKGRQDQYSAFVIEVMICQNKVNQVFSTHALQNQEDAETAADLPSHGLEQAAFGLLTEAARREVLLQALIKVSQDSDCVQRYLLGTPEEQEKFEAELGANSEKVIHDTLRKMLPQITKEIMVWIQNPLLLKPSMDV